MPGGRRRCWGGDGDGERRGFGCWAWGWGRRRGDPSAGTGPRVLRGTRLVPGCCQKSPQRSWEASSTRVPDSWSPRVGSVSPPAWWQFLQEPQRSALLQEQPRPRASTTSPCQHLPSPASITSSHVPPVPSAALDSAQGTLAPGTAQPRFPSLGRAAFCKPSSLPPLCTPLLFFFY